MPIGIKKYYDKLITNLIVITIFLLMSIVICILNPNSYTILILSITMILTTIFMLKSALKDVKRGKIVKTKLDSSKYKEGIIKGFGMYERSKKTFLRVEYKNKEYRTPSYFSDIEASKYKGKKIIYQIIDEDIIIISILN